MTKCLANKECLYVSKFDLCHFSMTSAYDSVADWETEMLNQSLCMYFEHVIIQILHMSHSNSSTIINKSKYFMKFPFNVHKNIAFKQVPCHSNIYPYSESNISTINKTNAVTTSWPVFVTACRFVSVILIKFILLAT